MVSFDQQNYCTLAREDFYYEKLNKNLYLLDRINEHEKVLKVLIKIQMLCLQLQKPEPFVNLEFKKPAIQQFLETSKSQTQIRLIPLVKED